MTKIPDGYGFTHRDSSRKFPLRDEVRFIIDKAELISLYQR